MAVFVTAVHICCAFPAATTVFAAEANIDILHSDMWQGNSVIISDRFINGGKAISVSLEEDAGEFSFFSHFDGVALSGCSEVVLSISLRGAMSEYDVSVVLGSGAYRSDAFIKSVKCQGIQKMYVPISPEIAASFDYIEISVPGSELPIYAMLCGITADDSFTYATLENFDSDNIECQKGTCTADEGGISIAPDSLGGAAVLVSFMSDTSKDGTYIVWLDAASRTAGSIGISAELDEEEVPTSHGQIIAAGSHSYVFFVEGAFSKLSFSFDGLSLKGAETSIRLTGAGALYIGEHIRGDDADVGTVTSCKYENGRVAVTGELNSDAALKYVNAKLGLYVIPMWEKATELPGREPDVTAGFSTLFTLYASPDENYMNCLYQPVIITDDENIPIGYPIMVCSSAGQGAGNVQNTTAYAIDGASPSGAIEANADSEIIDIYVDRLLESQDIYSASLYSYRGTLYYFDSKYFDETARRINFASDAGIRVYARIISGSDRGFDFDADDKKSVERLCAVCDYLKTNFAGKIHGYIMGDALNATAMISPDKVEKTSRLAIVFIEALRGSGSTEIYLPFSEVGDVNPFAAYAAMRYTMAKQSFASGAILYTCTDDPENAVASVSRTVSVANSYGYPTDSSALIWKAHADMETDSMLNAYAALCKTAITSGLRFSALDAGFGERNGDIYTALKRKVADERISATNLEMFNASAEKGTSAGEYSIRNFETSYDTTGWIVGGTFENVMTEVSLLKEGRALRTHSKGSGDVGMLAYRFEKPMDMSQTNVALSFGIVSADAGVAEVSIIFGCGDSRREYSANVEYNKPTELFCGMNDAVLPTDYIAVIVHGSSDCAVELYNVSLYSSELSDEEMKEKYSGEQTDAADPLLYVSIILVAAGTVAVFSAFAKKKDK